MKMLFYTGLILTLFFFLTHGTPFTTTQVQLVSKAFKTLTGITLAQKLGLSPKQKRQLYSDRAHYRVTDAQLDAAIAVKKAELQNELDEPVPNQKKLTRLCQAIGALYGKKVNGNVHYVMKEERKVLTPWQLTELLDSKMFEKNETFDLASLK